MIHWSSESSKSKAEKNKWVDCQIFDLQNKRHVDQLNQLLSEKGRTLAVLDSIDKQMAELVKIRHPREQLGAESIQEKVTQYWKQHDKESYGVWVYYPWLDKLVHLLPKEEFIELRTARNRYKITDTEQKNLRNKKVGIIGLSVGQSAAVTLAMERIGGILRLADFDHLDLSNLNRLRSGVADIGLPKTTLVAREIAEMDPFLKLEIFEEGITPENLTSFLGEGDAQLDLLVEECDEISIKIMARKRARELKIPVVMDTSDRGMLDVERFDLEENRPLLHGLIPFDDPAQLQSLTPGHRIGLLYQMVGGEQISQRLKASFIELGQSIGSWPQLASSVTLGGGLVANTARRILLGEKVKSGRFYVDMDELIPSEKLAIFEPKIPKPFTQKELMEMATLQTLQTKQDISREKIQSWIEAAAWAPSSGNDQPWIFVRRGSDLFVIHEVSRSYSFGDHNDIAALQSIGAAIENLAIKAQSDGFKTEAHYFPNQNAPRLVAQLSFIPSPAFEDEQLVGAIENRITNRKVVDRVEIPETELLQLQSKLRLGENFNLKWLWSEQERLAVGEIIAACDKERVFNAWGHYDFFHREMRWTPQQVEDFRNGIDIRTLEIEPEMMAAIGVLKEQEVVATLEEIGGGDGFNAIAMQAAVSASAFGLFSMLQSNNRAYDLEVGRHWERFWLLATSQGYSIHPLISPVYLFEIVNDPLQDKVGQEVVDRLLPLQEKFRKLWRLSRHEKGAFLFKIFKTNHVPVRTNRLPINQLMLELDGAKG